MNIQSLVTSPTPVEQGGGLDKLTSKQLSLEAMNGNLKAVKEIYDKHKSLRFTHHEPHHKLNGPRTIFHIAAIQQDLELLELIRALDLNFDALSGTDPKEITLILCNGNDLKMLGIWRDIYTSKSFKSSVYTSEFIHLDEHKKRFSWKQDNLNALLGCNTYDQCDDAQVMTFAVRKGDLELVQSIFSLAGGFKERDKPPMGKFSLGFSVKSGHFTYEDVSLIELSIREKQFEITRWLFEYFPQCASPISDYKTVMGVLVEFRKLDLLTLIHSDEFVRIFGVDLSTQKIRPPFDCDRELLSANIAHFAIFVNNFELLKWAHSLYPNLIFQRNTEGHNGFHIGISRSKIEILQWIYDQSPLIISTPFDEQTSMVHHVIRSASTQIVKWFHSVDPESFSEKFVNDFGYNVAHMLSERKDHEGISVAEWLYQTHPRLFSMRNTEGLTPMELISKRGSLTLKHWIKNKNTPPHILSMRIASALYNY